MVISNESSVIGLYVVISNGSRIVRRSRYSGTAINVLVVIKEIDLEL